ncbi:HlyD family efflux transporter periplasmic adaptor subunit [Paraburkholderia sp. SG-MS1]|uniref:HlyD family efflux transporter periplasmic adaptor subunit n=1 Tax=Paraburkholderia sp. SG-MS1 TaxID=2023741 RepID=UPI001EEA1A86|nr:HlyD family efflux transporter periplasmic adaptor subunit [Paraburkholderia sp. SG-MS1]
MSEVEKRPDEIKKKSEGNRPSADAANRTQLMAHGEVPGGARRGATKLPGAVPAALPMAARSDSPLPKSSLVTWLIAGLIVTFLAWAAFFNLDEVSSGTGKIVPTSKEQVIQSLEGGILVKLPVKEGDIVDAGQVVAQLDRTRTESTVDESESKLRASEAMAARLAAEVNGTPLTFPEHVQQDPNLVRSETALYRSRRDGLSSSLNDLSQTLVLVRRELSLTEPLVAQGAASAVEVLRLKRQINELEGKQNDLRNDYFVKAREELAKANAEVEAQRSVSRGREDALTRLTFTSPVRGIVKDIAITTLGGVIPPNGKLMEIVPLDDKLLVEARISPRDVAFLHPGQDASVKITAYDYSIFGGLKGKVTVISPDTIQDDVKRDVYYYRVYIRTDADHLVNKAGKMFSIVPGMVATVDIQTGRKSVLAYLMKPLNRGKEALRER